MVVVRGRPVMVDQDIQTVVATAVIEAASLICQKIHHMVAALVQMASGVRTR